MASFPVLQFLTCKFSDMRELPPVIGSMAACRMIDMSDNVITSITENVGELHDLNTLVLKNNVRREHDRLVHVTPLCM